MKIIKKSVAIAIATAMMFSLSICSMAASTESLTVTFESNEGSTSIYPEQSDGAIYTTTNGLLVKPSYNSWVSSDDISYAKGVGVGGSGALNVCANTLNDKNNYRGPVLMTKAVEVSDTKGAVLSYKVKFNVFNNASTTEDVLRMAAISSNNLTATPNQGLSAFLVRNVNDNMKFITKIGGEKSYPLVLDKWYIQLHIR